MILSFLNRSVNLSYDTRPSFHHKFNAKLLTPYLSKKDSLLDIGCWTGQLVASLRSCHIVGVDIASEPLHVAKKLYPEVSFFKASVLKLPFPEATFSAVAFSDVIEHLPTGAEKRALKEIRRVIKPEGKLLLTTMLNHPLSKLLDPAWILGHRHYSEKDLKALLETSNFKILKIYKTGGFARALSHIVELFYKHLLSKKFYPSQELENLIKREYASGRGFYEIHIVAEAK